jgi:sarcosine oxidase/L-pipecolate oxidase
LFEQFFPVIGRLIADALEGKLEPELKSKFAIDRTFTQSSLWRAIDPPQELKEDELCNPADLLP